MNTEAKNPNKIISKSKQQCIKNIIFYNQVGFIPDIQIWLNVQKIKIFNKSTA